MPALLTVRELDELDELAGAIVEITDKTEVTDKTEITERTEITEETNRMDVTERTEITERTGGEIYRGGGRLLSEDWTNLSYCVLLV